MKEPMISVRVRSLVKRFGETRALNNVQVTIDPGELFFLLGPSGCGKTTLLRCLAGFYIPEEGHIHFGDEEVTRLEPHKRKTGMMFQSYALWPHMTIRQNVAFGLEQQKTPKGEIRELTDAALESVRMTPYADRKPNQLSGGQQQRVALARALVVRPRCLLLDEPLSNLDAKLRHEMRSEIRRVCKEYQLTTVYVTHDQKEALSIADRMAVMDQGNILQVGTPLEVYKRPRNKFVANFIGDSNFLEGEVRQSSEEGATVETAIGLLQGVFSNPEEPVPQGGKVTVSIRPETLKIQEAEPALNKVDGKLEKATYYGEVAHYSLKTGSTELQISELNPRHVGTQSGELLYATVDPEDVVFLNG